MKTKSKNEAAVISEKCSCAGAKLDRLLQPAILAILASENLNGYRVGKRLDTMAMFQERKPDASGMYRTLREFEHRGLIAPIITKPKTPDAKVYHITTLGTACLERWVQTLANYHRTLGSLLEDCKLALNNDNASVSDGSRTFKSRCCRKL